MSTINEQMTQLAEAIRSKSGATGKLSIAAMTSAVDGIEINTGSDIDFTGVNVTADALKEGIVAVNASGVKITGTAPVVALTQDGNTVSIAKGFTEGGSITITPEEPETPIAATVTVIKNTVTITAGVIEAQTVEIPKVTPKLTKNVFTVGEGYIEAVSIAVPESVIDETEAQITVGVGYIPVQMVIEKGSGSGASFAKVTKYIPGHAAYEKVESIAVSGFGYNEDMGEDYSAWNGTYGVSEQSITENNVNKTIFEHPDGGKYLYRIYDEENGDYCWIFSTSSASNYIYDALYYKSELTSGDWESYDYGSVTLTIAKSSKEYAESPEVLEAVEVTFDNETGSFTITETPVMISAYETTPKALGIYLSTTENKLIGQNITFDLSALYAAFENLFDGFDFDNADFPVYNPFSKFLCYFPLDEETPFAPEEQAAVRDLASGIELFKTGGSIRGGVVSAFDDTTCWTNGWNKDNYLAGTIEKNFLPQDSFSIRFLAYHPDINVVNDATVIDFGAEERSTGFGVWTMNYGSLMAYHLRVGSDWDLRAACTKDNWHLIDFTFAQYGDGYIGKAYVDGKLTAYKEYNSTQYVYPDTTIAMFGRKGTGTEANGSALIKLDEVYVWSSANSDGYIFSSALELAKETDKITVERQPVIPSDVMPWRDALADYEVTSSATHSNDPGALFAKSDMGGNGFALPSVTAGAWVELKRIKDAFGWTPTAIGIKATYTEVVFEATNSEDETTWKEIGTFTTTTGNSEFNIHELINAPNWCHRFRFRFTGSSNDDGTISVQRLAIYRG